MKNNQTKGLILTLAAGVLWGFSGASGQYLFNHRGVVSNLLVPWRLFVSGVILLIIYTVKYKSHVTDVWKTKRNARDLIIFTIGGLSLCQYTYFLTIEHSNAGTATVLQYLYPVFIMMIVCIIAKRLPNLYEVICIVFALGGTFLIATHAKFSSLAISKEALIIGLICAWSSVSYTMQPKKLMAQFDPGLILGWSSAIGGVILWFVVRGWTYTCQFDIVTVLLFLVTSVGGVVFGYTMYLTGVKIIGPFKASIFACVEPVVAACASAIQGTAFSVWDIAGFALIISTIIILALCGKKEEAN